MKLTNVVLRQHIGWHFSKNWIAQGKRRPIETGAEALLKKKGVKVVDSKEFLIPKRQPLEQVNVVGYGYKKQPLDNTHPDWQERVLFTYKDNNVLLEGLSQAKIITKTVEVEEGLPDNNTEVPKDVHKQVKNIILNSWLLDAEQEKLPKIKDPNRPAFNFPRIYGVSQNRRNKLLIGKLLQLIESKSDESILKDRYLFNDLFFSFPFEKNGDLIQFKLKGDSLLTSRKPLAAVTQQQTDSLELPDIYPIKETITLNEENIYKVEDLYPISSKVSKHHPHTLFIHYNDQDVANLFEEEVTESQVFGRSLMKTFTVAASYARQEFGKDVKNLPQPVVLQCVHTNSQWFHFGVLQLNSLDVNSSQKNIWYQTEKIPLFDKCKYEAGKPELEGYNREVIKNLIRFYNNV